MTGLPSPRPRALFVTPTMPAESGNGLAMRAGLFLEGLARSHDVSILVIPVFGIPPPPDGFVDRLASAVEVLALDPEPDLVADLVTRLADPDGRRRAIALHPRPTLACSATAAAAEAVALAATDADLVHVMRLYLAPVLDDLIDLAERPRCTLDVDDLESNTRRRFGQLEEARRYTRMEEHYLPKFDLVFACSSADAAALARRCGSRAVVVPNAVRLPRRPVLPAPRHRSDLIFVGTFGYGPNVDGARWLCQEVLPRLGEITVALVGRRPGPEVVALAADDGRVRVTGTVADVAPWYAGARAAVVPLHAGGGSRIKLFEAFAHHRPVVATSIGAEGLEPAETEALLIEDEPEGFAAACRRLLEDYGLAERLVCRADSVLADSYTVEVVARRIDGLLSDATAPGGADG